MREIRGPVQAALRERLLMRDDFPYQRRIAVAGENRMTNRRQDLADNHKRRVDQQIQRQPYRALGRIFNRYDAEVDAPVFNFLEDRGERRLRHKYDARSEARPRRLVRVRMLRAQQRDPRLVLERPARGTYFDIDSLDLLVGERPLVFRDHLLDNRALAPRLIY